MAWTESRSNTPRARPSAADSGLSPVRTSRLRMPLRARALARDSMAFRFRSRQEKWTSGSIPASSTSRAIASGEMARLPPGLSVMLIGMDRQALADRPLREHPGGVDRRAPRCPRPGTISQVTTNSPFWSWSLNAMIGSSRVVAAFVLLRFVPWNPDRAPGSTSPPTPLPAPGPPGRTAASRRPRP